MYPHPYGSGVADGDIEQLGNEISGSDGLETRVKARPIAQGGARVVEGGLRRRMIFPQKF